MLATVAAGTALVVTVKLALFAPALTVTLGGTLAAAALLDKATTAPPAGAGALSVTAALEDAGPTTPAGFSVIVDKAAAVARGAKVRVEEKGPQVPAAFLARTRHHRLAAGRAPAVHMDTFTVWLATSGAANVDASATWTS
jgi:hypothetical protein